MKNRRRFLRKLFGISMAVCLTVTHSVPAAAASEETRSLLSTALTLADNDFETNQGTILILLQNCLHAAEGDEALQSIVSSIVLLLESGSSDAASVMALLQAALDIGAPSEPDKEGTAAQDLTQEEAEEPAAQDPAQEEAAESGAQDLAQEETEEPGAQNTAGEAKVSPVDTLTEDVVDTPGDTREDTPAEEDFEVVITNETNAQPQMSDTGLPIFEVAAYIRTLLQESVIVAVPKNWGNNGTGKALTTFSPVNASGAISPLAGTLSITYFPMENDTPQEAYDAYVKSISDMSVVAGMTAEDTYAADLPAKKLDFMMNVGANQFTCETICFAYEETVYAIELMQGQQTEYDYFPVYDQVVESAEIGGEDEIAAILSWVEETEEETVVQEEPAGPAEGEITQETGQSTEAEEEIIQETGQNTEAEEEIIQDTPQNPEDEEGEIIQDTPQNPGDEEEEDGGFVRHEVTLHSEGDAGGDAQTGDAGQGDGPAAQVNPDLPSDMGTFMYELDGRVYQFPTSIEELQAPSLQLDKTLQIPYDFSSDHDMAEGTWTELVNTQYYYFENAFYKEMAGVTNMKGYPVPMSECMLTALIDTQGSYVDITLPGGIRVGSPETDIIKGFPEFEGRAMDGLAGFRENELLYACNVRDDGCRGYVLVRNDDPYYSAVSIICDQGVVIEISFECIGSVRATGVFL